jgi:hypothetical protein
MLARLEEFPSLGILRRSAYAALAFTTSRT